MVRNSLNVGYIKKEIFIIQRIVSISKILIVDVVFDNVSLLLFAVTYVKKRGKYCDK